MQMDSAVFLAKKNLSGFSRAAVPSPPALGNGFCIQRSVSPIPVPVPFSGLGSVRVYIFGYSSIFGSIHVLD